VPDEGIRLMRIGMEISPLIWERTGIQNYILGLLGGLAEEGGEHTYILYTNRPLPFDPGLPENFSISVVDRPSPRFQLWFQLTLPILMKRDGLDLFHGLFYRLPLVLPVPSVLTVHDLSGYKMPELHTLKTHMVNLMYPLFVKRATRMIAVSGATASELERHFPGSSLKTDVIHEAAPEAFNPVTDEDILAGIRTRYSLPDKFILFLGTLEPRKNLSGLIDAFTAIADDIPQSLVITGSIGWKSAPLLEKLENSSLRDRIHLTGYVDGSDIPALLSMADVFVYPSLYEGFGIPVLEAMACGAPVVTSSVSSMPEVAGDAALLADPRSSSAIAEALRRFALNPVLRDEYSALGLRRASEFSWRKAAAQTLDVYRRTLEGDPSA